MFIEHDGTEQTAPPVGQRVVIMFREWESIPHDGTWDSDVSTSCRLGIASWSKDGHWICVEDYHMEKVLAWAPIVCKGGL